MFNGSRWLSTFIGWVGLSIASLILIFLLFVPLLALFWFAWPAFFDGVWYHETIIQALQLSLVTATVSTIIATITGVPLAYTLVRKQRWYLTVLDILIDIPMVLPPAVAGVALLMTFGRNGLLGQYLSIVGLEIPFTVIAVIMAQTFVSLPFFIRSAKVGFAEVDPRLEQISTTLGESNLRTFWRVTLPLARNGLIGGAVMTWARALGEFGATILFAGNLPGYTQTMPLAIYTAMQTNYEVAIVLAAILLMTSFGILVLLRMVTQRGI